DPLRASWASALALGALAAVSLSPGGSAVADVGPIAAPPETALRSHADDVVVYALHATLDASRHSVTGTGTIHWRNTSRAPVRELWLHLYLNAFKNGRSAFLRERVGGRGSSAPEGYGSIEL